MPAACIVQSYAAVKEREKIPGDVDIMMLACGTWDIRSKDHLAHSLDSQIYTGRLCVDVNEDEGMNTLVFFFCERRSKT